MPSFVLLRCYHLSRQYEWYCCGQLLHVNSSNWCARMAGLMQNETGLAHFALARVRPSCAAAHSHSVSCHIKCGARDLHVSGQQAAADVRLQPLGTHP